jgi:biopolymer transport protein ExbD
MKKRKTSWRKQAVIVLTVISAATGIIVGFKQLFFSDHPVSLTNYSTLNVVNINGNNGNITVNQFLLDTIFYNLHKENIIERVGLSKNPYIKNEPKIIDTATSKYIDIDAKSTNLWNNKYAIYENNGIGDNNLTNVVIRVKKNKKLSQQDKSVIIKSAKNFIEKDSLGNNYVIQVNVISHNQTSYDFGMEIMQTLKTAGFKIEKSPSYISSHPPHKNIFIIKEGNKITFDVGYID